MKSDAPINLVSGINTKQDITPKLHVTFVRGPIVSSAGAINNEATPSIAFAYLTAFLEKQGYRTQVVDAIGEGIGRFWNLKQREGFIAQGLTFDEIISRIPLETDVIGVSAMFSGEWPVTRDLINAIRLRFPRPIIIAGGEHVTALPEFSLRDCPALNYCVRGEGEYPLFELLEILRNNGDPTLAPSVAFLKPDGEYHNPSQMTRIKTIDEIPWPKWPVEYLENFWKAGKSYGVWTKRDMPFMASRGCPYQCTFCSNPQMWSTRYILRDVEDVISEIKHYLHEFQITSLQFYDLTAITRKQWTVDFCNALIREGIQINWSLPSGTRSEALDAETLGLLKQTGCNYLVYAPETGSQRTADIIKKRIKLPKFTESVLQAKAIGLVLRTNLIIGFPHETRRDVFETVMYGLRLALRGVDEVSINIFSPYPGSEIFIDLVRQGKVTLNDAYFFSLTSLNSDYTTLSHKTVNANIGERELAFYRIVFMLANYLVGYLAYPKRIFRTFANVLQKEHSATTVFEHRLRDRKHRNLLRERDSDNLAA